MCYIVGYMKREETMFIIFLSSWAIAMVSMFINMGTRFSHTKYFCPLIKCSACVCFLSGLINIILVIWCIKLGIMYLTL